ncbi:hypothetical protein AHAS_Ahas13G0277700 [Arachis hypogaea]
MFLFVVKAILVSANVYVAFGSGLCDWGLGILTGREHMRRQKLCEGVQNLVNLNLVDLNYLSHLVELLGFSKAPNLEEVNVSNCKRLQQVPLSVLSSQRLSYLFLNDCNELRSFQHNIHYQSLKTFSFYSCIGLREFSLTQLNHSTDKLVLSAPLERLKLNYCSNLSLLPENISILSSLKDLSMCHSSVKDVRWNAELGGQNMKLRLVEHFADEFNKQVGGGIDVRKFPKAMAKLKKQVRYRPNTPLVLKGITLSIYGGEKIGVAGRTGSGKSTLIQVFFRLVEPSGGKIIIDGTDISVLGLHDLRSCFGIIPQEPVLFEGTVRSNIDLTGQYTNEDIWKSLERCQLKEAVSAKPEKLDSLVVDNGENWSVGQRQLLCSGRVMLKQSRILFMDEVFKLSTARSA